jgi:hypothetical protein
MQDDEARPPPPPPSDHPRHTIDPETGIWPISEWGFECARGFVCDERFARPGDRVIKRTGRKHRRAPAKT